jgi:hypothetical protein
MTAVHQTAYSTHWLLSLFLRQLLAVVLIEKYSEGCTLAAAQVCN